MYCINCGKELREGAAFCVNCGTPTGKQNRPATAFDAKEQAAAGQGKKKSAKVLVIVILLLCMSASIGWFVIQKLNANWPDVGISEEKQEVQADIMETEAGRDMPVAETEKPEGNAPEAEGEEAMADMPETESQVPEEDSAVAGDNKDIKEEENNETGIHTYELIVEDVTWIQAYQKCLEKGGYLVRINSDEEYQAILQQISDEDKRNIMFWLGGARSSEESEDYRWVYEDGAYGDIVLNGEDPYLSYWLSGEPSYFSETGDVEMYMNMFFVSKEGRWVWNDAPDDLIAVADFYAGTVGYICEYEGN